ncbi:WSD1 family O-acyltransferase [Actinomadura sp. ATCC 31491]|uniref:WSD1 family O-acyltransferase n=1 Tax=Actinomadura luzonensis TaxID=2805427 RepID=A0ABT0G3B0_9ACTN|nr:WS/DGAT domain-containing protein [Actinomadura luzonensis]MCK2218984.1 WSD1 family O-acyltransferase [Actinomadura luzonensis]
MVRADLEQVRAAAHRSAGTVNDALLTAVTGALRRLLERRGEHVTTLNVLLPTAVRATAATTESLGNELAAIVAPLPVTGAPRDRLARVADVMAARKRLPAGPLARDVVAPLFRLMAGLGLHNRYLRRQRRFHTLLSNVRGPATALSFAGARITGAVPVAVGESGNVTVSFGALSYAGVLTVACVADPARVPELDELAALVGDELARLTAG